MVVFSRAFARGEKAPTSSLPRARKLTFDEYLQRDETSSEAPIIAPIDVSLRGVGAEEFSEETDLAWLIAAYDKDLFIDDDDVDKQKLTKVDLEKPVPMGIALSLQENGHVDSIILCCYRRALIIRIRQAVTRWQSKELLLDKSDDLARLLYGKLSVEYKKIQLAGFHAALQSLHIHRATSLHSSFADLSAKIEGEDLAFGRYLPGYMRIKGAPDFAEKAEELLELDESNFRGEDDDTLYLDYLPMLKEAVSAFWYARDTPLLLSGPQAPIIDTSNVPLRDLDLGARLVAVYHAHIALQTELCLVDFSTVRADDVDPDTVIVFCERYSNRLRPNQQQQVHLRLNNGLASVIGVCRKTHGKRSWVQIKEGSRVDILGQLNEMTEDDGTISATGKEDGDRSQQHAVEFWYTVQRKTDVKSEQEEALDPSGLFYPLFYGEPPLTKGTRRKARKFGPLHPDNRYTAIEASHLDPAQKRAATALAAPLREPDDRITMLHGPPGTGKTTVISIFCRQWWQWVKENEESGDLPVRKLQMPENTATPKDWDAEEHPLLSKKLNKSRKPSPEMLRRKRDVERQRERERERQQESQLGSDAEPNDDEESSVKALRPREEPRLTPEDIIPSCWIVSQSNAAVKNVAEALKKQGVDFRILVSDGFYEEWHAHLFVGMLDELIVTKSFVGGIPYSRERLGRCPIILATISGLSSQRLEEGKVLEMRPIYSLIVDEASQIVLGAYPHLLARHAETLGRIAFFGDHKQLAPHGHDTIPGIESAFELPHLVNSAIMLDRCYRLPQGLASFISRHVYDSKLEAAGPDLSLQDTVRFFDIEGGREDKRAMSFVNDVEARAIVSFVEQHFDDHTLDFRVIVPYTGQRDEIEKMLKSRTLPWKDRVFTIDSFQGQESESVLISLVRDGTGEDGHTAGFLTNERRTNVLLSRTKKHMYIFTSRRFLDGSRGRGTLVGQLAEEVGEDAWVSHAGMVEGEGYLG